MQKITLIPNIKQTNKQKYWQQKPITMIHLEQKRTGQQQEQQNEFSSKINQKRVAHFVLPDFIWNRILSRTTHNPCKRERDSKIKILIEIYLSRFSTVSAFVCFFILYAPSAHSLHKFVGCCQLWNLYWNVFRVFV